MFSGTSGLIGIPERSASSCSAFAANSLSRCLSSLFHFLCLLATFMYSAFHYSCAGMSNDAKFAGFSGSFPSEAGGYPGSKDTGFLAAWATGTGSSTFTSSLGSDLVYLIGVGLTGYDADDYVTSDDLFFTIGDGVDTFELLEALAILPPNTGAGRSTGYTVGYEPPCLSFLIADL